MSYTITKKVCHTQKYKVNGPFTTKPHKWPTNIGVTETMKSPECETSPQLDL